MKLNSSTDKTDSWGLDFICPDGDQAVLNIYFEYNEDGKRICNYAELNCFSGFGATYVVLDPSDLGWADLTPSNRTKPQDYLRQAAIKLCVTLGLEPHNFEEGDNEK